MSNENDDIRSISFDKLNNFIQKNNFPSYRSNQIFNWINKTKLRSFDDMTNIPKSLVKLLDKQISTGEFGADMKVSLCNDGPVTINIDSKIRE